MEDVHPFAILTPERDCVICFLTSIYWFLKQMIIGYQATYSKTNQEEKPVQS